MSKKKEFVEGLDYVITIRKRKKFIKNPKKNICPICENCNHKNLCLNRRNKETMERCNKCKNCTDNDLCDKFHFYNEYEGRLNLDIFLKGVLNFEGDPGDLPNRVNRFKCVFQDLTYSDCLYNACDLKHPKLSKDYKLPESLCNCKHTGKKKCLADKVRLTKVKKEE